MRSKTDRPGDFVPFFEKADSMLDLLMLGLGLAFFVITIGYAVACDRL